MDGPPEDEHVLFGAEQQAIHSRLYEDAPVPYIVGTADGIIRKVNKQAAERLGYAQEELVGAPVVSIYAETPDGRPRAKQVLEKLRRGDDLVHDEAQMQTRDGSVFWARITIRSITNEAGGVVAHWGVFIDIEEQKALEKELRKARGESEAEVERRTSELSRINRALREEINKRREVQQEQNKQLAAMEASVVGMSIHESDGTFRYANPAHATIYGYDSPDELIGESWEILYDDRQVEDVKSEALVDLKQGRRWTGELRGLRKDGSYFDVLLSLTPLPDGGLACICQDVTRRKQQERELQRYADRLQTLHEIDRAILSAESPHAIADAALERVYEQLPCDRASVVVFDHESQQGEVLAYAVGGDSKIKRGARFPMSEFRITEMLESGQPEVVHDMQNVPPTSVLSKLQKEGIRSYISLPMMLDDELIGLVNLGSKETDSFTEAYQDLMREITDQVTIAIRQARLLEQVQKQTEELEQRVAERTAELESFTYSVSHDLRTPLRAIDGFSRLLDKDYGHLLDEEGQRLLSIVRTSASRMGQLIDDLLALSRLGRQEMRKAPIDMTELAHQVTEELLRVHDRDSVSVTIRDLPPAEGDRAMARTILTNLVSNSLKFTRDEAEPRIEIGAIEKEGAWIYFVKDNGAGFDMAYAHKLFGVFQRLHDDDEFEGTGVGLAIVERAVRRHCGDVWAEAEVDEGATIYFTLNDVPGVPNT